MRVVTKDEFKLNKEEFASEIEEGKIFIYPTDTIYGIGCDATNETSVLKIRNMKMQHDRPLSIIAPSVDWIKKNCIITDEVKAWLKKLPGPYTFVLKLKNKKAIARSVNDTGSVGVRIPNHYISKFVNLLGFPIISTSANISGKMFMTSIDDLDTNIKNKVDFFIDEEEIRGRPSTIVFLDKEKVEIRKR
jgi:L-threonylcarbamoyladenylate synthase